MDFLEINYLPLIAGLLAILAHMLMMISTLIVIPFHTQFPHYLIGEIFDRGIQVLRLSRGRKRSSHSHRSSLPQASPS